VSKVPFPPLFCQNPPNRTSTLFVRPLLGMKHKSIEPTVGPPATDFLRRRDSSLFVPKQEGWSNFQAWMVSCVFHTILLVLFALLLRPQPHGTAGEADRPVGIAVLHETNHGSEYFLQKSSGGNASNKANGGNAAAGQSVSAEMRLAHRCRYRKS
jgi:hypothetical protein